MWCGLNKQSGQLEQSVSRVGEWRKKLTFKSDGGAGLQGSEERNERETQHKHDKFAENFHKVP